MKYEVQKAIEALKPFAEIAMEMTNYWGDPNILVISKTTTGYITLQDCRNAHHARIQLKNRLDRYDVR